MAKIILQKAQGNPERSRRIACLGTSANPPHFGHLRIAEEILKNMKVQEVWLIPCWRHSFGKQLVPWKHRWNMVKLMEQFRIRACDIEFQRKGISYTIDTVQALKKIYPQHEFFWIVGSDIIKSQEYERWKSWKELSREIKFWVVQRGEIKIDAASLPSCFTILPIKTPNISSTNIREKIRKGLSIEGLVPLKVKQYIEKYNLYRV